MANTRTKRSVSHISSLWAGMSDDKIHITKEADTGIPVMAIFKNKKVAKSLYEDVRPCLIVIGNKKV